MVRLPWTGLNRLSTYAPYRRQGPTNREIAARHIGMPGHTREAIVDRVAPLPLSRCPRQHQGEQDQCNDAGRIVRPLSGTDVSGRARSERVSRKRTVHRPAAALRRAAVAKRCRTRPAVAARSRSSRNRPHRPLPEGGTQRLCVLPQDSCQEGLPPQPASTGIRGGLRQTP
jgi:hypothetical protein